MNQDMEPSTVYLDMEPSTVYLSMSSSGLIGLLILSFMIENFKKKIIF